MVSLKIDNNLITPFGTTFILELHESDEPTNSTLLSWDSQSFIKIYLYNETETENWFELQIPDCKGKNQCAVEIFAESIKDLVINQKQWETQCSLEKESSYENVNSNIQTNIGMKSKFLIVFQSLKCIFSFNFNAVLIIIILVLIIVNVLINILLAFKRRN